MCNKLQSKGDDGLVVTNVIFTSVEALLGHREIFVTHW
jgi:hypothetical protein